MIQRNNGSLMGLYRNIFVSYRKPTSLPKWHLNFNRIIPGIGFCRLIPGITRKQYIRSTYNFNRAHAAIFLIFAFSVSLLLFVRRKNSTFLIIHSSFRKCGINRDVSYRKETISREPVDYPNFYRPFICTNNAYKQSSPI